MIRGGAAAAALALLAGAAGCCTCAAPPTFTVRHGAARAPAPFPAMTPAVRALHLGDFGDSTCQQAAVADAIALAHRRAPFDLGLAAGDLVYDCGPDPGLPGASACAFAADGNTVAPGFAPPVDPSFGVHDGPLAALGTTPVYVALGNHDVAVGGSCGPPDEAVARRKACLNVAHAAPQWVMPGRHYAVDRGPARFIVVDSNLVSRDYGGFTLDDEVAFVAAQSAGCADRTCFLVGHHPPATAGEHRDDADATYLARMQRLLDAGGGRVRAWLAGHDHDLQHLRTPGGLDVLVSGSGSRGRWRETFDATSAGAALVFASVRWGFGVLEVAPGAWRYRFEDERGEPLYCCAAAGAGPCEPTTCP
ncbi:MAG TPA: metallophosphoesterase [Anaeromyxobacter sp.]|nr:metallophosphoesterase [Anaeromyxobacter sp.]